MSDLPRFKLNIIARNKLAIAPNYMILAGVAFFDLQRLRTKKNILLKKAQ